ncbi:hypothetical protein EMIT0P218_30146 [Pseudomonas sp. IT-P218]
MLSAWPESSRLARCVPLGHPFRRNSPRYGAGIIWGKRVLEVTSAPFQWLRPAICGSDTSYAYLPLVKFAL